MLGLRKSVNFNEDSFLTEKRSMYGFPIQDDIRVQSY